MNYRQCSKVGSNLPSSGLAFGKPLMSNVERPGGVNNGKKAVGVVAAYRREQGSGGCAG
jgi:hypothetical protein